MLAQFNLKGTPKHPAQTPLEYAQTICETQSHLSGILVTEISQAYTAWRYGAQPQEIDRLQGLLKDLKQSSR